jgi:hypothetical protein
MNGWTWFSIFHSDYLWGCNMIFLLKNVWYNIIIFIYLNFFLTRFKFPFYTLWFDSDAKKIHKSPQGITSLLSIFLYIFIRNCWSDGLWDLLWFLGKKYLQKVQNLMMTNFTIFWVNVDNYVATDKEILTQIQN